MQKVQEALASLNIPVFALVWRPTQANSTPPAQYIVYTTMTTEDEHWDDKPLRYRVYVYLNLWSQTDPTATALAVRTAMLNGGFAMVEESDSFEDDTENYRVSSTWVIWTEVSG